MRKVKEWTKTEIWSVEMGVGDTDIRETEQK